MKRKLIPYILSAFILGNSCVLSHATANGGVPGITPGDISGDGKINACDISTLQNYILGREVFSADELAAADVNGDSKVNVFDLMFLKRSVQNGIDYGTPMNTSADMIADLRKGRNSYFYPSGPWTNGGVFDCGWLPSNIEFGNVMKITITDDPSEKYHYLSGEYRSAVNYCYGYYECSMIPIKEPGVDTGFFTYTGPSEGDPWDEIDFEFLGYDTTKVQLNYYTDGTGGHEYMLDLGFDAAEGFHTYGFLWLEDSITWYVDGVPRYKITENIPCTPSKIMVNAWPGINCDQWLKPFAGNVPLTARYQWITWCSVENFMKNQQGGGAFVRRSVQ